MERSCLCHSGLVHFCANGEGQILIGALRVSSVGRTRGSGMKRRRYGEPFSEQEDGRSAFGGVNEGGEVR